jgi:hypothetical protein
MSGTFPTTPGFSSMKFRSWQPTLVSVSHSLARQTRSRGGAQRWAIEAAYPPNLTRAELAPIFAFAIAQRGQYEIFTLIPPALWSTARGVHTGAPKVLLAGQTGRTINTDGWSASVSGILLRGDFVKFSGHDKIYMVTADANSDASGTAALTIEPALIVSPADNESLIVENVPFSVSFASDIQEFDQAPPNSHTYQVSFVEAF